MGRACAVGLVFAALSLSAHRTRGDAFDRLDGQPLAAIARSKEAARHERLTTREIDALPSVLPDTRSTVLVATTNQGNYSRLLVSPALYAAPGEKRPPVPVLVIERFDTFEAGNLSTRLARGKDLFLFDGFRLDLDSGQVVPEEQGGDLQFLTGSKEEGPRLQALGKAALFTLTKAPAEAAASPTRPSLGRSVTPSDFAGRYRLFANGQWSGTLELKVDAQGMVSGRFRSDLNGTAYPVQGKVAPEVPQKIAFSVKFPRTQQDFEGLLWTEGKGAMAGSLTMLEHAYGFFAVREGSRFAPEGEDVGALGKNLESPGRKTVTLSKGQFTLDGKPKTDLELSDALKKAVAADPSTWVLLQVPGDETFDAINRAFETLGSTGVASVRLAPASTER